MAGAYFMVISDGLEGFDDYSVEASRNSQPVMVS